MNNIEFLKMRHGKIITCPKCKQWGIFRYYPITGLSRVAHNCIVKGLVNTALKWCDLKQKEII